ncbi:asparagine synthase (glutamine-hydrolyzing) [Alkalihalobacillus sp. AL-G]|uniref:asparagine synthase (glutamine-hydrolyzing) n=1 Tax=Alkalihalobacillus sp. AL-G TaxID=2926399 RepID=UPI002729D20E|nr:asparagine synthase (glutamine-hydrolyzing) [Alkalihalobacillus sp. AL-G]WLD93011.1 asparagine synthase (glutamine-hydrolyzing) [Alkalihalobacillus sp. AL-G]
MCGFAGFINRRQKMGREYNQRVIQDMTNNISHRGPDDSGYWIENNSGLTIGHRRLSIIDLSPSGHQPMASFSGRYIIAFNGEIYNFHNVKEELFRTSSQSVFQGHSDTEVILAAVETWGLEHCVNKFVGMFAFALYDRNTKELYLVRDRIGEKPLYYGWKGDTFLFASELKALRKHPSFDDEIDRDSLALYMRHNYIPTPYSIYKGIYKLEPGTILKIHTDSFNQQTITYWSIVERLKSKSNFTYNEEQTSIKELDNLINQSINQQMLASDVPVGAFLSGGIDSSTIVSIMQSQSSQPIKTFTIGFNETGFNEATHAKKIANYLGTDHTELYVTAEQAMDVIPKLPSLYDEPFSDSSQIPTFLVSQLARESVTVSLSGDGGDELFGGYDRYLSTIKKNNFVNRIPFILRKALSTGLSVMPAERCKIYSRLLSVRNDSELYKLLLTHWDNPTRVIHGSREPLTKLNGNIVDPNDDFLKWMQLVDILMYLRDDILVKLDRASMGVSLESRIPLLDHRIIDFAIHLPTKYKISDNQGKWILRQVLYKYLPESLVNRPKSGFNVPIGEWLRGPLREWGEELLSSNRLREEGFFNEKIIRRKWEEHQSSKYNWHGQLWDVLMFQAWLESIKREK